MKHFAKSKSKSFATFDRKRPSADNFKKYKLEDKDNDNKKELLKPSSLKSDFLKPNLIKNEKKCLKLIYFTSKIFFVKTNQMKNLQKN